MYAPEFEIENALTGETRLVSMLTYLRPAGSQTEADWIARFIEPVLAKCASEYWTDEYGNIFAVVGPYLPRHAWTAHTDTVGKTEGRVSVEIVDDEVRVPKGRNTCLGADDGAGCAILLEMIEAGVEGLYCFFASEEVGGIGSRGVATKEPELFADIDFAVAFDRRGETSVITHQGCGRCASDAFAQALADAFNARHDDNMFMPDPTGVFTDTANLIDLVGECSNISVGYQAEHGPRETLDLRVWRRVRDAAVSIDWSALPIVRKPGEIDPEDDKLWGRWGGFGGSKKSRFASSLWDEDDFVVSPLGYVEGYTVTGELSPVEAADLSYDELLEWTLNDPENASELLYALLHRH